MQKKTHKFTDLMNNMQKNVLIDDFNNILNSELNVKLFRNKSIFITGATGLIGSLLVRFLLYANKVQNLNIKIFAMIRNPKKAEKIYTGWDTRNLHFVIAHLGKNDLKCDAHIDYIVHPAAITQSKIMIDKPVETIKTAVNGTEEILRFAVDKKVQSMVYVSSMEVYGQPTQKEKINENDLGYIDLTSARSCYPESKRMCEMLCTAYSDEYNINIKIARLAQTFGAGILSTENRVFAQFAKSIINHQNIVLHTDGKSEGNYIYTADAIKGLLFLLLNGETKEAYNISNEHNHMTIRQMADLVISNFGSAMEKVVVDIPQQDMGYAPEVKLWLDNKKIRNLGWKPSVNMFSSYKRMIEWMKTNQIN